MKNMKSIIFILLLVLLSPAAFALVWEGPYWLPVGTDDPNSIGFGGTATAASGAFSSIDTSVHYRAELRNSKGALINVLEEHDVDISIYTGYETVEIEEEDYVDAGQYWVRFIISDSQDTETEQLRLIIESGPDNNPPVLNFISDKTVYEGNQLQFYVSGSDPDGDDIFFSASNLPEGATFSPASRMFTWTPDYDQAGNYYVVFTIEDEHGATDSQTVRIGVLNNNRCPVLEPIGHKQVREGDLLQFSIMASDADYDTLFYSVLGTLPKGASFNSETRVFSWTPDYDKARQYAVTFVVEDGVCEDSERIYITVVDDSQPVVDLAAIPESGQPPLDVNFVCSVAGGDHPLTYLFDYGDGTRPDVLDTGITQHTYTSVGLNVATCTVIDYDGDIHSDSVGIDVYENECPKLESLESTMQVRVGETLEFTLNGFDDNNDTLVYYAETPFTPFLNGKTGEFSWTPVEDQIGNHSATFGVTDGMCNAEYTITIEVLPDGENHAPEADFTWSPDNPEVGEIVTFTSTSSDPDDNILTCDWDFDNDGWTDSEDCTAEWVFEEPGDHLVTLTVSDGELSDSETKAVSVFGQLNVTGISCFDPVIEGNLQSCSVSISANGVAVGGVNAVLYYEDGTEITNCITDMLTGNCVVTFATGPVGDYTVYATAEKPGWLPDLDADPTASFEVLTQRYLISNLGVYNDPTFSNEDYDFFRGEDMYVHFMVLDETGAPANDMVTSVALVSPPGGVAWFNEFAQNIDGNYWYNLAIPTTHDFLGDSQVFTFAFNFTDGSGAQMVVEVIIRNNPPVINEAVLSEFDRSFSETTYINLTPYESDVEDSGSGLTWSVMGNDAAIAEVAVDPDDFLMITPIASGYEIITLVLSDLDGDIDTIDVPIDTSEISLPQCSDGVDNDGDGLVDWPDDPGCVSAGDDDETDPVVLPQCSDGIDNDGDNFIDMDDIGCENAEDDDETNPLVTPQCSDGVDNDGDGLIDMADPGCEGPGDNDETDVILPECSDGIDNDGDGLIDLQDPHCHDADDDSEADIVIPSAPKPFHDMDDLLVTRIDIDGYDVESALASPGSYLRLSFGVENNLNYTLDDIKVDVSIWELDTRDSDMLRELGRGDSATVTLMLDIPEYAAPGLYELRIVISNDDVRRVKYRTIAIV